jgi:enoyl-[acyl-carrier protein] reductase I
MVSIDLSGKRALVAGVGDSDGFGWAIARSLAESGAEIVLGTWPPLLNIFRTNLERGRLDEDRRLSGGGLMQFRAIHPLDAAYDRMEDVPAEIRENKRYQGLGDYTVQGLAAAMRAEFGAESLDIYVHCIANGPEVKNHLLDTSRQGYLTAVSVSAYSNVALLAALGPLMRPGAAALSLTFRASQHVVPGYGGGMSSAKAALESDTRTLAYEAAERWGIRVNTISAGPMASRAAKAIGSIGKMIEYSEVNAPLKRSLLAEDVGGVAAFLLSPLARGITGTTVYVDNGMHIMGMTLDSFVLQGSIQSPALPRSGGTETP